MLEKLPFRALEGAEDMDLKRRFRIRAFCTDRYVCELNLKLSPTILCGRNCTLFDFLASVRKTPLLFPALYCSRNFAGEVLSRFPDNCHLFEELHFRRAVRRFSKGIQYRPDVSFVACRPKEKGCDKGNYCRRAAYTW